jgi:hypothetical protein
MTIPKEYYAFLDWAYAKTALYDRAAKLMQQGELAEALELLKGHEDFKPHAKAPVPYIGPCVGVPHDSCHIRTSVKPCSDGQRRCVFHSNEFKRLSR